MELLMMAELMVWVKERNIRIKRFLANGVTWEWSAQPAFERAGDETVPPTFYGETFIEAVTKCRTELERRDAESRVGRSETSTTEVPDGERYSDKE